MNFTQFKFIAFLSAALIAIFSFALVSCGNDDGDNAASAAEASNRSNGPLSLKIGSIFPETGSLAFLGPPVDNGYNLAIQEINAANAGITISSNQSDSGTDPAIAGNAADSHIADRVDAIVGPVASGISLSVIDKITKEEIVMISPVNTSPTFTTYDDGGYYFRTSPSDEIHAKLLVELIIDSGNLSLFAFYRLDDYGRQFAERVKTAMEEAGGEAQISGYDPKTSSFEAEVQEAVAANTDALLLVSFDEGVKLINTLLNAGINPTETDMYVTDGFAGINLAEQVNPENPGVINGITGTAIAPPPDSPTSADFFSRLKDFAPGEVETQFAPNAYDAVVILALAALQAGTTNPGEFVNEMNGITKDGQKCFRFSECAQLIADGSDIDYDGASGRLDFLEPGEPSVGNFDIFVYDSNGVYRVIDHREAAIS